MSHKLHSRWAACPAVGAGSKFASAVEMIISQPLSLDMGSETIATCGDAGMSSGGLIQTDPLPTTRCSSCSQPDRHVLDLQVVADAGEAALAADAAVRDMPYRPLCLAVPAVLGAASTLIYIEDS